MRPQDDMRLAQDWMPVSKGMTKVSVIPAQVRVQNIRTWFRVFPCMAIRSVSAIDTYFDRWLMKFMIVALLALSCFFVLSPAFCDTYQFEEDLGTSCKIYRWISSIGWPDTWSVYDKDPPYDLYCNREFSIEDARSCGNGRPECFDESISDFTFSINNLTDADSEHKCTAKGTDRIQSDILVNFMNPFIGAYVRGVSTILFPDGSNHDYYSPWFYAPSGYVDIYTDLPVGVGGLESSGSPYVFVSARVEGGNNNVLFNSPGGWTGGRCSILYLGKPPTAPSNLKPLNDSDVFDLNVNLTWDASTDPDGGSITYDVFFGSSINPPIASAGQSAVMFDPPGALAAGGVYYWYVVAKNSGGGTARAPSTGVMSFTAKSGASLSVVGAETTFCAPVTIKANLEMSGPVNGKTIYFYIGGDQGLNESGFAVTGKNCDGSVGTAGTANFCYTPSPGMEAGRSYSIMAEFKGDGEMGAISDSTKMLVISGRSTSIIVDYDGKQAFTDNAVRLGARLRDTDGYVGIYGKTVTFYDNLVLDVNGRPGSGSSSIGSALTSSDGWAYINWIPSAEGVKLITAVFPAEREYAGSKDARNVIVTAAGSSNMPGLPTGPVPQNGVSKVGRYNEYQKLVVDLSWQCEDPGEGSLTFDIYMDRVNPPAARVGDDILSRSFTTNALDDGVTYYWKVVPYNGSLAPATPVPVWSFTAGVASSTNVFYVSSSGNDSWTGTSRTHVTGTNAGPWKTINKAASVMRSGDKTVVLSGTYNEHVIFAGY